MATTFFFGHQSNKSVVQRIHARPLRQFSRSSRGQKLSAIHRNQPVKTLRFVHVSNGNDDAHTGLIFANPTDQFPELDALGPFCRKGPNAVKANLRDVQLTK